MKAPTPKEPVVVAVVSEADLDKLLSLGSEREIETIVQAMIKAMGEITKKKQQWWREMGKKYGFDPHKPGTRGCSVNQMNGEITEVPLNEEST